VQYTLRLHPLNFDQPALRAYSTGTVPASYRDEPAFLRIAPLAASPASMSAIEARPNGRL